MWMGPANEEIPLGSWALEILVSVRNPELSNTINLAKPIKIIASPANTKTNPPSVQRVGVSADCSRAALFRRGRGGQSLPPSYTSLNTWPTKKAAKTSRKTWDLICRPLIPLKGESACAEPRANPNLCIGAHDKVSSKAGALPQRTKHHNAGRRWAPRWKPIL